ncbi:MAG TPA: TRAP transporter large permease subunit [Candidatus Acidoferrales bacterium]|nr:TRAP transporter large permease subunit [Candidatus Acidoferrales bacterium]
MSDPALGLTMLGLIVIAIMMGFPTAFTLMGLGMIFGYLAFWAPGQRWYDNHIFDLIVQRTYGVMTNDTLISVPLFVFMGYIMERAALVDRMFHAVQLAFRRVPASLAVTTLLVCAFWGIASGIVGAVVVLMGVIAFRPMLNAGYDVRLAAGAITAGGTLGILIPPSVMLIVYAAVAGQSIVKLYAAAMLPGFFLTFLYLVYILGWAIVNPKIAPKLREDQYRAQVPEWLRRLERGRSRRILGGLVAALFRPSMVRDARTPDGRPVGYGLVIKNMLVVMVPLVLTIGAFGTAWWYVVIYNAPAAVVAAGSAESSALPLAAEPEKPEELGMPEELGARDDTLAGRAPQAAAPGETPQELGTGTADAVEPNRPAEAPPEEMTSLAEPVATSGMGRVPEHFYLWFWTLAAVCALLLLFYYWRMDGDQLEILKELVISVVPLGVLTVVVLAVILFGITTATESAAIGALGALYLAVMNKYPRITWQWSLIGAILGLALGWQRGDFMTLLVSGSLGATFVGTLVPVVRNFRTSADLRQNLKESVFLTAKTTAMVCWLFVGSALFSAVFALHGGQALIERWVLGMNLSPVGFMIMAQLIIFLLGWPLEWTEIIVIFCPIFIPLLSHFNIDPILFGTMVAVNLQAAFLSPPVAMSAFYLKGVSPPHVTLNQIFAGMMPYMLIVLLCLVFMYLWPGMTLWLPEFLYGG